MAVSKKKSGIEFWGTMDRVENSLAELLSNRKDRDSAETKDREKLTKMQEDMTVLKTTIVNKAGSKKQAPEQSFTDFLDGLFDFGESEPDDEADDSAE